MCGLAGYLLIGRKETDSHRIRDMLRVMAHRGPDDAGITLVDPGGSGAHDFATEGTADGLGLPSLEGTAPAHSIALGHRRFSIIDLSVSGHQPFWSSDRSVCVTFNGEVYNYVELRQELEDLGHSFRTHTDTEVIAEAFLEWGEGCLDRFNGFFAIVLYDVRRRRLWMARDRIGRAPLYVTHRPGVVAWASEIKSLRAAFGQDAFGVDEQAVVDYVRRGRRDLFHRTFFAGIRTFPNATHASVTLGGRETRKTYWELPSERLRESDIAPDEAARAVYDTLDDSVRLRLRADVSVALELSGGMDSSAMTALTVRHVPRVSVYTVSFPGTEADEEAFARAVVQRYADRIDYRVLTPPSTDFARQADEFIAMMDEPFHSPNVLSNQGIRREMKCEGIRVVVNGGAGDEVFAGYGSYMTPYLGDLVRHGRWVRAARELLGATPSAGSPGVRQSLALARHVAVTMVRGQLPLESDNLGENDPFHCPSLHTLERPDGDFEQLLRDNMGPWLMYYWLRAGHSQTMAVPVEQRAPFLDHHVVELGFRLPVGYLIRGGWHKWILRQAMQNDLPEMVVWRRIKMGFPFPYRQWLGANRRWFLDSLADADCPYVHLPTLAAQYDMLREAVPLYLWRILCLGLWWKRCVRGEHLSIGPQSEPVRHVG